MTQESIQDASISPALVEVGDRISSAATIRQALGMVKEQTSIDIAKISSAVASDLDVAIVRCTDHDDTTVDDHHACKVLRLTSHDRFLQGPRHRLRRYRLSKTSDYVVAANAKCLVLLHRLIADGDSHFRREIARRRAGVAWCSAETRRTPCPGTTPLRGRALP